MNLEIRKVKCDENHPCSNCVKHNTQFEYRDRFGRVSFRESAAPSASQDSDASLGVPMQVGPISPYEDLEDIEHAFTVEERRLLELRLINHFSTIVTYTFPGCNEQRFRDLWNIDAVRLALGHPFLLNAMLAISSLHLFVGTEDKNHIYARNVDMLSVARLRAMQSRSTGEVIFARAHRIYLNLSIRQQRAIVPHIGRDTRTPYS